MQTPPNLGPFEEILMLHVHDRSIYDRLTHVMEFFDISGVDVLVDGICHFEMLERMGWPHNEKKEMI